MPIDRDLIAKALLEDAPQGDITTMATVPADARATARLIAKEELVVCGLDLFGAVFRSLDTKVRAKRYLADGDMAHKGDLVAEIRGSARALLTGERVALNFMQRLSGTATMTRAFVSAVSASRVKILDTRKTTPLLRDLEKYAVRVGGGQNHRRDLSDMALIKENHISVAGGILAAVSKQRSASGKKTFLEVEVRDISEVKEAVLAGADRLLLDNMTPAQTRRAVRFIAGRAETESSGSMNLKKVRVYATTGVDFISVGALTHSAPAVDLSLLIEPVRTK